MDDSDDDVQAMFTPVSHTRTPREMGAVQDHNMETLGEDIQAISTPMSQSRTPKRAVSDELARTG